MELQQELLKELHWLKKQSQDNKKEGRNPL